MRQTLRVKRAQLGWFAAGAGIGRALDDERRSVQGGRARVPAGRADWRLFGVPALGVGAGCGQEPLDAESLPARVDGQAGVGAGGGCQPARRLLVAGAPQVLALPSAGEARPEAGADAEGRPGDG